MITFIVLLSLSYSSTLLSLDQDLYPVGMETMYEDHKEDSNKDNTVDKLDILQFEKIILPAMLSYAILPYKTDTCTFVYKDPLYKPPLFV